MIWLRVFQKEIILTVLFAALHSIIFHFPQAWWVASFSLVPLFAMIESTKSRWEALLFGYLAGVLVFGSTLFWVYNVTLLGYVSLILYLGVYIGIFSFSSYGYYTVLSHSGSSYFNHGWIKMFGVASLWVLIEFIRSHVPVLKFPWALFSYSQWKNTIFIQSADLIGSFGITFLIVLVNTVVYILIGLLLRLLRYDISFFTMLKQVFVLTMVLGVFLGANIGYGYYRLEERRNLGVFDGPKIAVIQGNIPQEEKWDAKIKGMIFKKYDGLSRQADLEDPDLIIWPETSFPGFWEDESVMKHQFKFLVADLKKKFFLGTPTIQEKDTKRLRMNSGIYFDEQGNELGRYNKLRLVPYGEYVPWIGFLRKFYEIGQFTPGSSIVLFKLPFGNTQESKTTVFSALICFEDIFADLCRTAVKNGSRILVNITNDAWFQRTSAPYQHAQGSVMRAVENRVPVVRAANTGLSGFIDEYGYITDSVKDGENELFVTGFKTHRIRPGKGNSFYTQWGDLAVLVSLFVYVLVFPFYRKSFE